MRENISGLDVFEERWKVALEAKYVVYEFSEQMVINLERTYAQSYICERICAGLLKYCMLKKALRMS